MVVMPRRPALTLALTLVASCAPLASPVAEHAPSPAVPTASKPLSTADVVSVRQAGPDKKIVVRAVASGAVKAELLDGILLPDGRGILTIEAGTTRTDLHVVDRVTGAVVRATTVTGAWTLRNTYSPSGISGNGKWLALVGSAYGFTDAAGKWTARSTFGVIDTAFAAPLRMVELTGSYFADMVSDDGRSLYVWQDGAPGQPTAPPSALQVYDLITGSLSELRGDPLPSVGPSGFGGLVTDPVHIGSAAYRLFVFGNDAPYLARIDTDARTAAVIRIPTDHRPPAGEPSLLWSMVATTDGRTLYVVNPAAGAVNEIDAAALTVRRTGKISRPPEPDLLARIAQWLAPVADAKVIVHAVALLSGDGRTLYAIGVGAISAIDTQTLALRPFAAKGQFVDVALSPDGQRLYALDASGRWMHVLDAGSGEHLAQVDVGAFPLGIVAVDPR